MPPSLSQRLDGVKHDLETLHHVRQELAQRDQQVVAQILTLTGQQTLLETLIAEAQAVTDSPVEPTAVTPSP